MVEINLSKLITPTLSLTFTVKMNMWTWLHTVRACGHGNTTVPYFCTFKTATRTMQYR